MILLFSQERFIMNSTNRKGKPVRSLSIWKKIVILVSMGTFMFFHAPSAECSEYLYAFGLGPSFSSGDYGTGDNIDIFYLPFIFKMYPSDRIRGTVVIPWVHQSSTQAVSAGDSFYGVKGSNNRANRKAFSPSTVIVTDTAEARDSESGLGDVILRGEVDLLQESRNRPAVILEGKVKLPTASESKGLGTGEPDIGIAAEVGHTVNRHYYYGRLGYTLVGEPSGADFDSPFLYEAGTGFSLNPDLYLNVSLEGSTSIDDDIDNPLEAVIGGSYRIRPDLSLNGYFLVGLSDGSPDFGLGLGFLQRY